jgi:anthranilate synthase component II
MRASVGAEPHRQQAPATGHNGPMGARVLVVDNYDSFVYNLVQYLGELGAEPVVHRNDALTVEDALALGAAGILLSPGPGRPEDAGILCDLVRAAAGRVPVLGVCLGHQAIGQVFGGDVVRAPALMHGKTSFVHHDGTGVFAGLPDPFEATRYHSLVVDAATMPDDLEVIARTDDGVVMGVRHREHAVHGVQFHPESILTTGGHDLLKNFLALL